MAPTAISHPLYITVYILIYTVYIFVYLVLLWKEAVQGQSSMGREDSYRRCAN